MKVIFELDLMDDPIDAYVMITAGSKEDYERFKKLHPPPEGSHYGEQERSGRKHFRTVCYTSASGKVDVNMQMPHKEYF